MSHPPMSVQSSEDARKEAEFHRQQIAETLDNLSSRIGKTVQTAQTQLNKPVVLIRKHPFAALGVSVGIGLALAVIAGERKRQRRTYGQTLSQAYYDGRRDEREQRPPHQTSEGNPHNAPPSGAFTFRSHLLDFALPIIRTLSGNMAEMMLAKKFRR